MKNTMNNCIKVSSVFLFIILSTCLHCEAGTITWTGGSSADWATATNWSPQTIPGSFDDVQIGTVGFNESNEPVISGSAQCATITFGTVEALTLTISGSLNVTGSITIAHSENNYISSTLITGTGSLICGSLIIGNGTVSKLVNSKMTTLFSRLANFTVSGDVFINSTTIQLLSGGVGFNNGIFSLQGGQLIIAGQIVLTNLIPAYLPTKLTTLFPSSAFSMDMTAGLNPQLKLLNSTSLNINNPTWDGIDFYNFQNSAGNTTVEYGGANQRINTGSTAGLNLVPAPYDNLIISGTGTKTTESNSGDKLYTTGFLQVSGVLDLQQNNAYLVVGGNFTNTGTSKLRQATFLGPAFSNSGLLTTNSDLVWIMGGNQSLIDNTITGTVLTNVWMNGNYKVIATGNFVIPQNGNWTVSDPSTSFAISPNAGLTLKADNTGQSSLTFTARTQAYP